MRKTVAVLVSALLVLAVLCSGALADSISPPSFNWTLTVGESKTITKTVTVTAGTPTTSKADVFFLADTTGSMGGAISSVISGASTILNSAALLGDVAFGVGEYKDEGDVYIYRLNQDITTSKAAAQTGINMWGASGGGDDPEAQLYALTKVASNTTWRADSARILVWFGDYPGHDPSYGGVTETTATNWLTANNIGVEALDLYSLNAYGQAVRIANATGGHYYSGVNPSSIVTVIQNAITTAFQQYNNVALGVSGAHPLVDVDITGSYTGTYDRSIERTFTFEVTYTCLGEGVDDFYINALVDGGIVAVEHDTITNVPIPEPMTMAGVLMGLGCVVRYIRRRG
jgi:hypothetical protein